MSPVIKAHLVQTINKLMVPRRKFIIYALNMNVTPSGV